MTSSPPCVVARPRDELHPANWYLDLRHALDKDFVAELERSGTIRFCHRCRQIHVDSAVLVESTPAGGKRVIYPTSTQAPVARRA